MLIGTFANANTNELSVEKPLVSAVQPISDADNLQTVPSEEDVCVDIYMFDDGSAIVVIYDC